ncbi:MAG: DUF4476 domain-containing protein [Bacteroidota bacterium]|nr:DUF4476 domain-containing protein [Bacteroidota bacterium]
MIVSMFLSLAGLTARSQQIHFIYIQTSDLQPFYIRLGGKIISSSTDGYVIIPKMEDGNYNLVVGFPKNEFPEENFPVQVSGKNLGFLLKNFGEKGWGLFNRQSFQITMGGEVHPENTAEGARKDAFSKMLATVVKDSTILQKTTVQPPPQLVTPATATQKEAADAAEAKVPVLLTRHRAGDSVRMVYVMTGNNHSDTVTAWFMPPVPAAKDSEAAATVLESSSLIPGVPSPTSVNPTPAASDHADQIGNARKGTPPSSQPVFLDQITTAVPLDTSKETVSSGVTPGAGTQGTDLDKTVKKSPVAPSQGPAVINSSAINSDCKAFATNSDFLKLRKKMAAVTSDSAMLQLADHEFHKECFSSQQVRNLAYLFLTDKGKFNFLVAAYPFTSDSDQFFKLSSVLTDPYYVNIFKAVVHK